MPVVPAPSGRTGRHTRADRLRQRREFERVYACRRRGAATALVVFVANGEAGRHRLGMAVPRRVGTAVIRNRIKRRLREAFRLNRHRIPGCYDIVVHARGEAADLPFAKLVESLLAAVRRAEKAGRQNRARHKKGMETTG